MSCGNWLPWCTYYRVWANLIKELVKYDFHGYSLVWSRSYNDIQFNKSRRVNVRIECKLPLISQRSLPSFTRYFSLLGFCLSRIIFSRSTLRDDFFESLRLLLGISTGSHCFSMLLIAWFGVLQKTINISQSFQDGWWGNKVLPFRNAPKGVIGASWILRG